MIILHICWWELIVSCDWIKGCLSLSIIDWAKISPTARNNFTCKCEWTTLRRIKNERIQLKRSWRFSTSIIVVLWICLLLSQNIVEACTLINDIYACTDWRVIWFNTWVVSEIGRQSDHSLSNQVIILRVDIKLSSGTIIADWRRLCIE